MQTITVTYHEENGSWWAETNDLPGFSALAPTLADLRVQVREGLAFALESNELDVRETMPRPTPPYAARLSYSGVTNNYAGASAPTGALVLTTPRATASLAFSGYNNSTSVTNCPA